MKTPSRQTLAVWFTMALLSCALPCAAQTVTSSPCKLRVNIAAIPQVFIFNNLRFVGATLTLDDGPPLSIAARNDCVIAVADGSGQHKFVVVSADGRRAQGSFDLDAAARADTTGGTAPHNEVCSFEGDGLECQTKRGWTSNGK
jgi:hypothetical protein